MARPRIKLALCLFLLLACACARGEKIPDIQARAYVTDLAHVIDPATTAKINLLCAEVDEKANAQIAVVTVNSLEGESKEDYAADLFKHLGIGAKKTDRGVLLLIAPTDREYRIEVGYGLESIINDAKAGDIGRAMLPNLKNGDYSTAAMDAVSSIADLIAADRGVKLKGLPKAQPVTGPRWPWWMRILALIAIFFFIRAIGRSIRRGGGGGRGLGGGRGIGPGVVFLPPMMGGWGGGGGFGGSSGGFSGGGGFGGFGGGLSGGGGAGGSW